MATPRIAITPGEPAGIGPDVLLQVAQQDWPAELVAIADPELLADRARQLQLPIDLVAVADSDQPSAHRAGTLRYLPTQLAQPVQAGQLNAANVPYVLATLNSAIVARPQRR
jgi:4-hydroxythreonine-4-phosphate dehydrogenase